MDNQKRMIVTMTGEIFQPTRLYYRIMNKENISRTFKKMSCMDFDVVEDRWVWLYLGEARNLSFKKPYKEIPQHMHPLTLGAFFTRNDDEMYLDIRSIERAAKAIVFFDKYISRLDALVTHVGIQNKIHSEDFSGPMNNFDKIFDGVVLKDPMKLINSIVFDEGMTREEKAALSLAILEKNDRENFNIAEKLPVHYYEEGIQSVEMALNLRQAVAMQHYTGNTDCRLTDIIRQSFLMEKHIIDGGAPPVKAPFSDSPVTDYGPQHRRSTTAKRNMQKSSRRKNRR